jgi:2-succinyl-5-enolpyruvyl-6-hydroxy-3-cyclohexene-1-carboxylate synthase
VDELVRSGVDMFAIAPGSRSSPLTHAVFKHPRAAHTLCIDERSLAFWAVGRAAATGRPVAIITTSGTAVANLLPAVVEASSSAVPLILLTADRPVELRDTGANQTIDQVKIFGSFVRWAADLPPPESHTRGSLALQLPMLLSATPSTLLGLCSSTSSSATLSHTAQSLPSSMIQV